MRTRIACGWLVAHADGHHTLWRNAELVFEGNTVLFVGEALDGFFVFGGPLNVTRYVIDPDDNKFGQSTDTYWVARFLLDEETHVIARLNALIRGPIVYYPVVYLLRRSSASVGPGWVMEQQFYKSWLFSLGGNFVDPRNPAMSTRGQTLGIAFKKVDNRQISPRC